MSDHHAAHAGFEYLPEGIEFQGIELASCLIDHRQVFVRINAYITVAGEVFGAGHHTHILHAFHVLNAILGHLVFIFPETAVVDHRVIGVVVYVHDRGVVYLDAGTFTLVAYDLSVLVHDPGILHGAQHHLPG